MYKIGVFISHSWIYTEHYEKLSEWLFQQPEGWSSNGTPVIFNSFSIQEDDQIHNESNAQSLQDAIDGEILKAHVVICPTGMYSTHSDWIDKEIISARQNKRKILGVNPWGEERESTFVQQNADNTVGWEKQSIVDGVWNLYQSF